MSKRSGTQKIIIMGKTYSIKSAEGESEHNNAVAAYVEATMKQILKGSRTVSTERMAILSALTIADELFRLKESTEKVDDTNKQIDGVIDRIDTFIKNR